VNFYLRNLSSVIQNKRTVSTKKFSDFTWSRSQLWVDQCFGSCSLTRYIKFISDNRLSLTNVTVPSEFSKSNARQIVNFKVLYLAQCQFF